MKVTQKQLIDLLREKMDKIGDIDDQDARWAATIFYQHAEQLISDLFRILEERNER